MTNKKEAMLKQINSRKYAALPGVESFVRGVWRHYPLAICSGALGDEIELMLEGISLRDCFTLITSAEDVEKGKPDHSLCEEEVSERAHMPRRQTVSFYV